VNCQQLACRPKQPQQPQPTVDLRLIDKPITLAVQDVHLQELKDDAQDDPAVLLGREHNQGGEYLVVQQGGRREPRDWATCLLWQCYQKQAAVFSGAGWDGCGDVAVMSPHSASCSPLPGCPCQSR
jgi:hypothetical protein